jgi:hypothetical protein
VAFDLQKSDILPAMRLSCDLKPKSTQRSVIAWILSNQGDRLSRIWQRTWIGFAARRGLKTISLKSRPARGGF